VRTIYTIGVNGKNLEQFVRLLQRVGVDTVLDIRLRNTSQLTGYAKKDDLSFLLREGFAIRYEHHPELAPTSEILDGYRATADWGAYQAAFLRLLADRDAVAIGRDLLLRCQRACLLCAEPTADRCHRRLVAEWWTGHLPDLEIQHL
jgi:uncharacterized protein (DUF488 family)